MSAGLSGMGLSGMGAIVTGGASGIGLATVHRLAAAGAAVAVVDLDLGACEAAVSEVLERAPGATLLALAADVTDPASGARLVAATVDAFGRLDIAVNNAGRSGMYAALPEQTLDNWNAVIAVNLTSVFLGMQAQIPAMLAGDHPGGSVVNVASGAGLMGFALLPAYVASKHGVIGLTKSVALEYARKGIRVNAVCPGSVRTPMLEGFAGGDPAAIEAMGALSPIGRLATPDEIAAAIVWLCTPDACFVTGTAFPVDGGVMAT